MRVLAWEREAEGSQRRVVWAAALAQEAQMPKAARVGQTSQLVHLRT